MRSSSVDAEAHEPTWARLGAVPPGRLERPRLVLHHAVQLLASFGQTLVEPRDDDSHRSMDWQAGQGTFLSQAAADGLRATVRVAELRLELRRGTEVLATFDLDGETVQGARTWLGAAVGEARGGAPVAMAWPEYEIPPRSDGDDGGSRAASEGDHGRAATTTGGAPLRAGADALEELARWYQDAFAVLAPLSAATPEASVVRCWPHHFDVAALLTFGGEASAGDGEGPDPRYVGVGMSPGDGSYDAPYFYVNGWPAPDPVELPALDGPGGWHTEGWTGAVLEAEAVVAMGNAAAQRSGVEAFLRRAADAMKRAVLG